MSQAPQNSKIHEVDIKSLEIIKYPDPRLRGPCVAVDTVDDDLQRLVEKMFELMFAARGVGLAAAQVGVCVQLFVSSPTVSDDDRHVYLSPEIISAEGSQVEEEGCLSLPGILSKIKRAKTVTIRATGLDGQVFEQTGEDLVARVFQHEMDHIEGRLLLDRMGTVAKLTNRQTLKELENDFGSSIPDR